MDDIKETFIAKNADYGSSFAETFEEFGVLTAVTRMSDKWNRLKKIVKSNGEHKVADETLEDTLLDLATYAIMTVAALNTDREKEYLETVVNTDGVERA